MRFLKIFSILLFSLILLTACMQHKYENTPSVQTNETTYKPLDFTKNQIPNNFISDLQKGGYVIVFRYTGSGGGYTPVLKDLQNKVIDDGQRISENSVAKMKDYGKKYRELNIPIQTVVSSEYFFVWQHAYEAFNDPITISRDLTGSLNFKNNTELNESIQQLKNRIVQLLPNGQNQILFTHQGKFDKAFGYYIPAGTTLFFKPDGSNQPNLITVLSYEQFMSLK